MPVSSLDLSKVDIPISNSKPVYSYTLLVEYPPEVWSDSLKEVSRALKKAAIHEWNAWSSLATRAAHDNSKTQWNRDIRSELLRYMPASIGLNQREIEEMLTHFLYAYQTYRQLSPDIDFMIYGGMKGSRRIRSIVLPLCSSLIEGCYINLARSILIPLSRASGKDYTNLKDLSPTTEALRKNGLRLLADTPDIDLRNSISHGGISIKSGTQGIQIEYTYLNKGKRHSRTTGLWELERKALDYLETVEGTIVGLCDYFDQENTDARFQELQDTYVRGMYLGFNMSDDSFLCLDVSEATSASQLNYAFDTIQTDDSVLFEKAETLLTVIRRSNLDYDNYCVTFSHPRMPANFIRATAPEIDRYIAEGNICGELISNIGRNHNMLWSGANREDINETEAEYYVFPHYENEKLAIFDIEDVSSSDRKRLKANVFVSGEIARNSLLELIDQALNWIKPLYNPPSMTMQIMHGNMDTDCIYLNVFRSISDSNRSLAQNNNNFICQVEYCPNPAFRLADSNGFIAYLYQNSEWMNEEIRILWRERQYLTHSREKKMPRNSPCPCGSGKKYKNCCGSTHSDHDSNCGRYAK